MGYCGGGGGWFQVHYIYCVLLFLLLLYQLHLISSSIRSWELLLIFVVTFTLYALIPFPFYKRKQVWELKYLTQDPSDLPREVSESGLGQVYLTPTTATGHLGTEPARTELPSVRESQNVSMLSVRAMPIDNSSADT